MIEALARNFLWTVNGLVLVYFVLLNSAYFATSLLAFHALRRYSARLKSVDIQDLLVSAGAPPITLIVPAYNEEATCVDVVRSLLTLNYPEYEVIVVNDGSRDATADRLVSAFEMVRAARMQVADFETAPIHGVLRSRWHPNLWLVDKDNGGKADALNSGLAFCQTPLFCVMDADTILERDALLRVVRPFLEDQRTVAAGGVVRVVNGCTVDAGQWSTSGSLGVGLLGCRCSSTCVRFWPAEWAGMPWMRPSSFPVLSECSGGPLSLKRVVLERM